MTVLDASALLAYLLDEPGADLVQRAIEDEATLGAVNLAEVLGKLADAGVDPDAADETISVLPLAVTPFDEALAVSSARLRPATAGAGLSLGDRACLALAIAKDDRVLTADAAWLEADLDLDVVLIR